MGPNRETRVNAMRLEISLNGAEADALDQILARHVRVLDMFEKNQLVSVVKKATRAREDMRHQREAWRRLVWTKDDIVLLRHGRGTPDTQAATYGRCTCECHGGGVTPRSAPGRAWCSECLAERARMMNRSLV